MLAGVDIKVFGSSHCFTQLGDKKEHVKSFAVVYLGTATRQWGVGAEQSSRSIVSKWGVTFEYSSKAKWGHALWCVQGHCLDTTWFWGQAERETM